MSDPLRTDPARAPELAPEAERDAKIEQLLLAGLDHYFAAQYEQAVNIWTRALFLDRSHARARAYIERARSALAEQQRESEELLHTGVAAFERGELETARQLLNAAVRRGGAHEVALAFLTRIDRINAAGAMAAAAGPAASANTGVSAAAPRRLQRRLLALVALLAVAAALAYGATTWRELREAIAGVERAAETRVRVSAPKEPLTMPRAADAALDRARALQLSGHLHDALRAAELVKPGDPLRPEADKLRATIQRELLALQTPTGAASTP